MTWRPAEMTRFAMVPRPSIGRNGWHRPAATSDLNFWTRSRRPTPRQVGMKRPFAGRPPPSNWPTTIHHAGVASCGCNPIERESRTGSRPASALLLETKSGGNPLEGLSDAYNCGESETLATTRVYYCMYGASHSSQFSDASPLCLSPLCLSPHCLSPQMAFF